MTLIVFPFNKSFEVAGLFCAFPWGLCCCLWPCPCTRSGEMLNFNLTTCHLQRCSGTGFFFSRRVSRSECWKATVLEHLYTRFKTASLIAARVSVEGSMTQHQTPGGAHQQWSLSALTRPPRQHQHPDGFLVSLYQKEKMLYNTNSQCLSWLSSKGVSCAPRARSLQLTAHSAACSSAKGTGKAMALPAKSCIKAWSGFHTSWPRLKANLLCFRRV